MRLSPSLFLAGTIPVWCAGCGAFQSERPRADFARLPAGSRSRIQPASQRNRRKSRRLDRSLPSRPRRRYRPHPPQTPAPQASRPPATVAPTRPVPGNRKHSAQDAAVAQTTPPPKVRPSSADKSRRESPHPKCSRLKQRRRSIRAAKLRAVSSGKARTPEAPGKLKPRRTSSRECPVTSNGASSRFAA